MRRYLPLLLLPILSVLAVSARAADEPPRAQFEGRVDVREVLLDVLVTDRQGNVIVGLKPQDFQVTENGKPVDLSGLSFYSNRRFLGSAKEAEKSAIATDAPRDNRYFILLFDDVRPLALDAPELVSQQLQAARKAKEWVSRLLPNDWVAVATYDRKLKIHSDFTRDQRALQGAIQDAVSGKDPESEWPSRAEAASASQPSLLGKLPKGKALRDKTESIYDALTVLAEASDGIVGRKNLLLFTTGFGQINSFGQYLPDPRYYTPTQQALNDANVAVYTIDLTLPGTDHTLSGGMNQIAADTGGTYLFNFVSFSTPLAKISEENNGYYLLAYKSERPAGAEGYQKVQVKVTNPEFKVKAREGYSYGKSSV
ncbi:MAG TPA: VWA domain-containing protein [Thermoanaerobaculia bacterium]|jgi:VWFA-related protein|nr:VWA domain-containing protein [Thermoanaerobaculia bacterium]